MASKYEFKFYPTGFTWIEKGFCNAEFQPYDNILSIRLSKEHIVYINVRDQKSREIDIKYEENTEDIYNDVLNHWVTYLENPNSHIEQYIDKKIENFVSQFDLFPGGTEYEAAKTDFKKNQ